TETRPLVGAEYKLNEAQEHHAKNVLRLNNETVRLVYEGEAYLAHCTLSQSRFKVTVTAKDETVNEPAAEVILAPALIMRDKFELVLQKAAELGATRIVPFTSSRCIIRVKQEKKEKQRDRWEKILTEASQQCKRNRIPVLDEICRFADLKKVAADVRIAAYEAAGVQAQRIPDLYDPQKSVMVVIGPEGGFSEEEIEELKDAGFACVTLGSRILRAETAAMYALSVIAEAPGVKR
ncbi:MAG: 16S rRNA (uracil(1498)-N(3))-methyltransferase, partial [Solobacterium sp.]|nr:16S rRNA (uracil(1498)-N(3))-methyltransferase [Solobacterium sp.]